MKTFSFAVTRVVATMALTFGVASCKKAGSRGTIADNTIAHITITANGAASASIKSIQLQLALGGKTTSADVRQSDGADVVLPLERSVRLAAASGTVMVVATALDGDGNELGHGTASGAIVSGSMTRISVGIDFSTATPDPGLDMGTAIGADMATDVPISVLLTIDRQPSYDFGTVDDSIENGPVVTFTVTNAGTTAIGPLAAAARGGDNVNPSPFETVKDGCVGRTLAPGVTCPVTVQFSPGQEGPAKATLTVSAPSGGSATVATVGSGLSTSGLGLSPSVVDFDPIPNNTTSDTTVTVNDSALAGSGPLTFTITGSDSGQFSIVDGTCKAGQALTTTDSCTLVVRFGPTSGGDKAASLVVAGNPGVSIVAPLTGTSQGPARLAFTPATYHPPAGVPVGATKRITLTLTNLGAEPSGNLPPLQTTQNSTFTIVPGGTCTVGAPLAGGANCTMVVAFSPTTVGTQNDSIAVTTSPGGTAWADIRGNGTPAFKLTVTRAGNSSGSVTVDGKACAAYPCAVVYSTIGTAPLAHITATPDVGATLGWTGCDKVDAQNQCSAKMDRPRTVEAAFNVP
jgi:hypothetical protein